ADGERRIAEPGEIGRQQQCHETVGEGAHAAPGHDPADVARGAGGQQPPAPRGQRAAGFTAVPDRAHRLGAVMPVLSSVRILPALSLALSPDQRPGALAVSSPVFFTLALSSAMRSVFAKVTASSWAQKCMKYMCGWSSSMWLCSAVTSMPPPRSACSTGFTSLASSTKSPVIAALPWPSGWKL